LKSGTINGGRSLTLEVLNGKRKNNKESKEKLEKILRIDQDFAMFYQRNAVFSLRR